MLVSTRGFVLHQVNYSETSLVVKIFTEHFGLRSYIVKGVRKKGSKVRRNLFEPLTMLDLVAYQKDNANLHMLKEVSCHRQFSLIPGDITRSSILLFMTELLYRSIPGEMADTGLFTYIAKSLEKLDSDEPFLKLFPLTFSLGLTAYLGFNPRNNYSEKEIIFDMQEGVFIPSLPVHHHFLAEPFSGYLAATLSGDEMKTDLISYPDRRLLLDKVMEYFRLHLGGFGEMKSIQVLGVVLND